MVSEQKGLPLGVVYEGAVHEVPACVKAPEAKQEGPEQMQLPPGISHEDLDRFLASAIKEARKGVRDRDRKQAAWLRELRRRHPGSSRIHGLICPKCGLKAVYQIEESLTRWCKHCHCRFGLLANYAFMEGYDG